VELLVSQVATAHMDIELRDFLIEFGFASSGQEVVCTPLGGGVSCDVWRVDAGRRSICVKRALPRLRVASVWEAPVARNTHEWRWLNFGFALVPGSVPRPLAHDPVRGLLAMEYLEAADFPVWKQLLLLGEIGVETARSVAAILVRLHGASANNPQIAAQFATDDAFYALRIEPYLLEAARRNPHVAGELHDLANQTLLTRVALVHGDVSPKNILVGSEGPVFLDAETAWYGDPAFDVAFCLNHLLLKCLARPAWRDDYMACFGGFASRYVTSISWEVPAELERRAVRLLPALLLARVDGKSPVEYLDDRSQSLVRQVSCRWLTERPESLKHLARLWRDAVRTCQTSME
jgi:hypothetical protein